MPPSLATSTIAPAGKFAFCNKPNGRVQLSCEVKRGESLMLLGTDWISYRQHPLGLPLAPNHSNHRKQDSLRAALAAKSA